MVDYINMINRHLSSLLRQTLFDACGSGKPRTADRQCNLVEFSKLVGKERQYTTFNLGVLGAAQRVSDGFVGGLFSPVTIDGRLKCN